jgi:ATP phosphoribosyltransferase
VAEQGGTLRLALPSDGELYESSLSFLRACGLPVERASSRRYTGHLSAVSDAVVMFQRASDIPAKVEEGSAELGIAGLDRFLEARREGGDAVIVLEDLRFGRCELLFAVPDGWVDVTTMADLGDLAIEFRAAGRELRVATKYPRLVQRALTSQGIHYVTLIPASGTLEAAPAIGYADLIADLTGTGTTLRENRLRPLDDGSILVSQACLIANRRLLAEEGGKLSRAKAILERIEGNLRAQDYCSVVANVPGTSEQDVATYIRGRPELAGIEGPTVSAVFTSDDRRWFDVGVLVEKVRVLEAVEHLRAIGGDGIRVIQPTYLFLGECRAYQRLVASIEEK